MAVKIGCCGFPLAQARYARHFHVVEVQQTFYQVPALKTLQGWRARLPAPFEFTLKAWQLITHEASSPTYRRLKEKLNSAQLRCCGAFRPTEEVENAWQRTVAAAKALGARVVLFQCPASFTPTEEHIGNLSRFFKRIDRGELQLVWEPRGAWEPALVRRLCRELQLVHGVDPFQSKPRAGNSRYFRLHGRGGYRYTDADLRQLADFCKGPQTAYVLFNNVSMWDDALRFQRIMQRTPKRG